MDFSLSEEQQMFRKMFDEFVRKEVARVAEHTDKAEEPPMDVLRKAAAQGFLGGPIPEAYGGAGLDHVSYAMLIESIARECLSTAIIIGMHTSLVGETILEFGTEEQKERWLPALASGESIGAFAMTEPDAGSDPSRIATRALKEGDAYVLHGVKTWVSNGAIAGLLLVIASSDPSANGKGLSAFVVAADAPGLKIGRREPTMGLRGLPVNTVYFDGVRVPESDRLGEEGHGLSIGLRAVNYMRLGLGAAALGSAEGALELGKKFAVERKQFGVPIGSKQALGNYFADSAADIEALRWLVMRAAWLADHKQDNRDAVSMCKLIGARVARDVANRMLQVHGGYGFSDEYAISKVYRDARALDLLGGTGQIQRVVLWQSVFEGTGVHITP
ncbi:MAG TPA: acyl-CoA dehydrogenase family protein [Anaerolineae bacterium]|nr:acyl-CoA dehydrogenase family protein [Anaerolineae bacterium]